MNDSTGPAHLRVPATSANLGPGFDTLGVAMSLFLDVDAEPSAAFAIEATGRSPEICGSLANNLILMTYTEILGSLGLAAPPLRLRLQNGIPIGMGCGSSAAALVAGVLLASHFGELHWTPQQILEEAARREGHPDNVAACVLGGFAVAAMRGDEVWASQIADSLSAKLLLALPPRPLRTSEARAVLPQTYSRADAVANVQASSLLVAALAANRPELLRGAVKDWLHEPFREPLCPLYRKLTRLRGVESVYGVALSGAGPAVLLLGRADLSEEVVRVAAGEELGELLGVEIVRYGASSSRQLGNSQ